MKKINYGSYIVCHEHLKEVKSFLSQFFEETDGKYNHFTWITFAVSDSNFVVNLMEGKEQVLTQNMTFEINCNSMEELQEYADKFGVGIKSFSSTESKQEYTYHYIEIVAPANICKMEISFSEDK